MPKAEILKIHELVNLLDLELPNVQRDFVWKPSQIENLWDSLLRLFPAGAFIADEGGGKTYLLDGQQRATSILLGFADLSPEADGKILKTSAEYIRIFLDMRRPNLEKEGRKFAFRVVTRSHPWGYQRADNAKTLTAAHKSAAADLWGPGDPFALPLGQVYPYDAVAPLPLNIFTRHALAFRKHESPDLEELKNEMLNWVRPFYPEVQPETLTTWLARKKNQEFFTSVYSLDEIYETVAGMIENYAIPLLPIPGLLKIDPGDIYKGGNEQPEPAEEHHELKEEKEADDESDDVEEVFIRLNSAGTPLGGEELNYSLLKSKIDGDLQEAIKNACDGIMKPARFISLAYRLYQQDKQRKGNKAVTAASIDLRLKPRQFQRELAPATRDEFVNFIQEKVLTPKLLEKVKSALKYKEEMTGYDPAIEDYRLPYPLFIKIAAASQGEIMFLLMSRLIFGGGDTPDLFEYNTREHRQMVAIILLFLWHGKDNRSRHNKLLNKIWFYAQKWPFGKMWSKYLLAVASGENSLQEIPLNDRFLDNISNPRRNTKIWNKFAEEGGYSRFVDNVMGHKDFLLWIQRKFIATSDFFNENLFRLDSSDVPFDWDHISPENLVKNKRNIPQPLKDLYQQPANLRAWPYMLNRADHDHVPAIKLDIKNWKEDHRKFIEEYLPDSSESNNYLLESSFCARDWRHFTEDWLNDDGKISDDKWNNVYDLILDRWRNMYKTFSKEFDIRNLADIPEKIKLENVLSKARDKWRKDKSDDCIFCLPLPGDHETSLFIAEYDDGMQVGFRSEPGDSRISENRGDDLWDDVRNCNWRYIIFQISFPYDKAEYKAELASRVHQWLDSYPEKNIAREAREFFDSSLR